MNIEKVLISANANLRDALRSIEAGAIQAALVIDGNRRLLGVVSDGDIRRGLLRGMSLEDPVIGCANTKPLSLPSGATDVQVLQVLRRAHVHHMPLVDSAGRITDLKLLDELVLPADRPNLVVLMVGGMGKRLGSLTQTTPKPMLPVGGRPLLETIVTTMRSQGFRRFRMAVSYMREMIEEHFKHGEDFDCEISYIRETAVMGTAGALGLLDETPTDPIIVSNGDLLLQADFAEMMDHHNARQAQATIAVREHEYQVPYGVVEVSSDQVMGVTEKPTHRHLIAAGVYVLSPECLPIVPRNQAFYMPDLIRGVVDRRMRAMTYNLEGSWIDIGRVSDYELAQKEFQKIYPS